MKEKHKLLTLYSTLCFNSKAQIVINNNKIIPTLNQSIHELIGKVDTWIKDSSNWYIDTINDHYLNTAKYKSLNGKFYIKLPENLMNLRKVVNNFKNSDNECCRWCHIRYLSPKQIHAERIKKDD